MVKLSIGFGDIGFMLMKFGLILVKNSLPENTYIALKSAIEDSELMAKEKFNIKQVNYTNIDNLCKKLNLTPWFWDRIYHYVDINSMKKIMRKDLTDRLKYYSEKFDCDQYATLFASIVNVMFGINCVGIALGAVLDKNTKNLIGYHAWNLIITEESNQVCLYSYEPQEDILKKVTGREIDMDWAIYRCDLVIFR